MKSIRNMSIWKSEEEVKPLDYGMLAMDIADLTLSVRSYNCLRRAGCETVGDVIHLMESENGLRKVRNLGTRSETEILEKIEELRTMCVSQNRSAAGQNSAASAEEPTKRLVKPAKKVWDKEISAFPISRSTVKCLHACGIQTVGDLYENAGEEPGWFAVRELFDAIAW